MTCKCNLCGREDNQIGGILGVDLAEENGELSSCIRSVLCAECMNKIALKIKEVEDEYN